MLAADIQKNYIFPRIPVIVNLPDNYPDVGVVSNISVTPEITSFNYKKDELELEGSYMIAVAFYKAQPEPVEDANAEPESDDFFGRLKLGDNGLLSDSSGEVTAKIRQNLAELYTVHFNRQFHTYVDLEFIPRPRSFRPGIVVEKAILTPVDNRSLKGELVLSLINRPRRSYR